MYKIVGVSDKEVNVGEIRIQVVEAVHGPGPTMWRVLEKEGGTKFWVTMQDLQSQKQAELAVAAELGIDLWENEVPFDPQHPAQYAEVTVAQYVAVAQA